MSLFTLDAPLVAPGPRSVVVPGPTPRWYQAEALDAILAAWREPLIRPCVSLPTGSGKSLVTAHLAAHALAEPGRPRVLVLAHVRELLVQHEAAMRAAGLGPSLYSAGLGRRELGGRVVVAGIQSVFNRAPELVESGPVSHVIIDEAHLIPREGSGRYLRLLDDLEAVCPGLRLAGLTATPFRTDSGLIYGPAEDGEDAPIFTHLVYEAPMLRLMSEGFLAWVTNRVPDGAVSDSAWKNVKIRKGEFAEEEASALMAAPEVVRAVALATAGQIQSGQRRSALVFCQSREHAALVYQALGGLLPAGVVAYVDGNTPDELRNATVAGFKAGKIKAIVNIGCYTTGFDAPCVDLVVLARATTSPGLYSQMVGRGLRPSPGKVDALVLDFGGNARRFGPLDKIKAKRGEKSGALMRPCPGCGAEIPAAAKAHPQAEGGCGWFEPEVEEEPKLPVALADKIRHGKDADHASPILSRDAAMLDAIKIKKHGHTEDWVEVGRRVASAVRHSREGDPDTLRVDYYTTGGGLIGTAYRGWRPRPDRWWGKACGYRLACPATAAQAAYLIEQENAIPCPSRVRVTWIDGEPVVTDEA